MKILKIGLKRIRNGGGRATCSPFLICLTSMAGLDELLSKRLSTLGLKKKVQGQSETYVKNSGHLCTLSQPLYVYL